MIFGILSDTSEKIDDGIEKIQEGIRAQKEVLEIIAENRRYLSPSLTMSANLSFTMSEMRSPRLASRIKAVAALELGRHPVKPCFMV